jgi:hypothetical protein
MSPLGHSRRFDPCIGHFRSSTAKQTLQAAAGMSQRCQNRKSAHCYLASIAQATKALIDAIFGWLALCTT